MIRILSLKFMWFKYKILKPNIIWYLKNKSTINFVKWVGGDESKDCSFEK